MVKGIHKQIIEIKCTNSEYFEKILLIVRSDRNAVYNRILSEEAAALLEQLPPIRYEASHRRARLTCREKLLIGALSVAYTALLAIIYIVLT